MLIAVKGWASLQVEQTYLRARELAERSADPRTLFPILFGLWVTRLVRAQFRAAYGIGEELLLLAEKVGDFNLLLQAHQALGDSLYEMGQFELARKHLEAGLTLCNRERLKALGVDMWKLPSDPIWHAPFGPWVIHSRRSR